MTGVRMTAGGFQINRRGSSTHYGNVNQGAAGPTLLNLPVCFCKLAVSSVIAFTATFSSAALKRPLVGTLHSRLRTCCAVQIAAPASRLPFQQRQRIAGTVPDSRSLQGALFAQQHLDTLSALTLRSAIAQRHGRGLCVLAPRG